MTGVVVHGTYAGAAAGDRRPLFSKPPGPSPCARPPPAGLHVAHAPSPAPPHAPDPQTWRRQDAGVPRAAHGGSGAPDADTRSPRAARYLCQLVGWSGGACPAWRPGNVHRQPVVGGGRGGQVPHPRRPALTPSPTRSLPARPARSGNRSKAGAEGRVRPGEAGGGAVAERHGGVRAPRRRPWHCVAKKSVAGVETLGWPTPARGHTATAARIWVCVPGDAAARGAVGAGRQRRQQRRQRRLTHGARCKQRPHARGAAATAAAVARRGTRPPLWYSSVVLPPLGNPASSAGDQGGRRGGLADAETTRAYALHWRRPRPGAHQAGKKGRAGAPPVVALPPAPGSGTRPEASSERGGEAAASSASRPHAPAGGGQGERVCTRGARSSRVWGQGDAKKMGVGGCIVVKTSPNEDEAGAMNVEQGGGADGVRDWCAWGAPRLGKGSDGGCGARDSFLQWGPRARSVAHAGQRDAMAADGSSGFGGPPNDSRSHCWGPSGRKRTLAGCASAVARRRGGGGR